MGALVSILTNLLGGGMLGTIVGGVLGIIGKGKDIQLAKMQAAHELEMRKLELSAQADAARLTATAAAQQADLAALAGATAADRATYGDGWSGRVVDFARGLVRPVITYAAFALVVAMTVDALKVGDRERIAAALNLCSVPVGFWFGSRLGSVR